MKETKVKISLILESSVTYGFPINEAVGELIARYRNRQDVELDVFVPEVVLLEAKQHLWQEFQTGRDYYKKGAEKMKKVFPKRKHRDIGDKRGVIFQKAQDAFNKYGITVLETPVDNIDWSKLIFRAVSKELPFEHWEPGSEKKREAGFKDTVIAETILHEISKDGSKSKDWVLICKDGRLNKFLKSKTAKTKNFYIWESLEDFDSDLKAKIQGLESKFRNWLTKKAAIEFDNPKSSLLKKAKIEGRIKKQYSKLFSNPVFDRNLQSFLTGSTEVYSWVPLDDGYFRKAKSLYDTKSNDREYIFKTTMLFRQKFERETIIKHSGGFYENPQKRYILEFLVKWKLKLNQHNKVTGSEFISDEHVSTRSEDIFIPTSLVFGETPVSSLATLSGRGTIPVSSDSDDLPVEFSDSEDEK